MTFGPLATAFLLLLGALVIAGAAWVVILPNLFRAALSLGLVLFGVAGLFILLEAEFLAFVQILIYVGAILTLVVFAIMLTTQPQGTPGVPASRQRLPAALVSGGLFLLLTAATRPLWPQPSIFAPVSLATLGQQMVTTLVLPFEIVSIVFVASVVGAIVLATAKRRPGA